LSLVGFKAQNHPQQRASDEVDDRATHPTLFDPLNERFKFTIDVAAAAHNAKCERFYTRDDDGLAQPWADESVWCNPPYSGIEPWVAKAWSEHPNSRGIVILAPANRTEQGWWQRLVEPFRDRAGSPLTVEFLAGRIRFMKPGQTSIGPNERPPFGCCLLIWAAPVARSLALQHTFEASS